MGAELLDCGQRATKPAWCTGLVHASLLTLLLLLLLLLNTSFSSAPFANPTAAATAAA
jgi:hypothetical protein